MLDPVSMMEDDSSKGVGGRNMTTSVGRQVQSFGVYYMQPTFQITVPDVVHKHITAYYANASSSLGIASIMICF